ncbi:dihydrodipicolinate synthase family protein [Jiangella sp. DSM 45060]|uniref:dihydrodipicolinate synthase family protein n=1 Tax=Jiangella sp. DSM 45060 TaxID=1798224 RepID=UPI00087BC31C|nr:dihydrodipicolinate synthase family protein [Jiangella sp. DSM 45060]SDT04507.1 Dihydrodipicolinate synthase/N-acetylneuraminate lyase [Jiangella sp. DSM 45060]
MATAVDRFLAGGVIPAHPLALDEDRKLDERRQRALSRYYVEAGATGLAVAVHTTQFAVHEPVRGLLAPVLELAAETAAEYPEQAPVLITGIVGPTEQAVAEAELAVSLGYDLALLTPYGTGAASEDELLDRARAVGEVIPVIGFYLQPAVGGRPLGRDFWRRLAEQPTVAGVKVAPFDRYATLEVVHGLAASGRAGDIAVYTGNDDHIVMDLLTGYDVGGQRIEVVGGLLGQWAVWVRGAVATLAAAGRAKAGDEAALRELLALNPVLTDANAAIFDAAHGFHGCVPGIHEVLRRQGLLTGLWCLDETEVLSPGQLDEIDRIWAAYPHLRDDTFITERLDRWLGA